MNDRSSRSHCMLCVKVRGQSKLTGTVSNPRLTCLHGCCCCLLLYGPVGDDFSAALAPLTADPSLNSPPPPRPPPPPPIHLSMWLQWSFTNSQSHCLRCQCCHCGGHVSSSACFCTPVPVHGHAQCTGCSSTAVLLAITLGHTVYISLQVDGGQRWKNQFKWQAW